MKRIIFAILIPALLFSLVPLFTHGEQTHIVTWITGENAYFTGVFSSSSSISRYEHGHVITSSDLPAFSSDLPSSYKYHFEWTGAVGTRVTEDTTFTLHLVSNYESYHAVVWKSSTEPGYTVKHINSSGSSNTRYFCDADIYPDGHVITAEDAAAFNKYGYDKATQGQNYHYEWTDAVGTVIDRDDITFLLNCAANEADYAAVTWYNGVETAKIRRRCDSGENYYVYGMQGCVEVFPKGCVFTDENVPETDFVEGASRIYTFGWDTAVGKRCEDGSEYYLQKQRIKKAEIRLYLDGVLVKAYDGVPTGTRMTLPKVVEGYEELVVYRWDCCLENGAVLSLNDEEFEVNFDMDFDGQYMLLGDINHDNTVNTRDAHVILKRLAAGTEFRVLERFAADMDMNGVVNTNDVSLLLRRLAQN